MTHSQNTTAFEAALTVTWVLFLGLIYACTMDKSTFIKWTLVTMVFIQFFYVYQAARKPLLDNEDI
jgi:hypothetical protein